MCTCCPAWSRETGRRRRRARRARRGRSPVLGEEHPRRAEPRRRDRLAEPAERAGGAPADCGSTQHLRRAGERRGRFHPRRPGRVPRPRGRDVLDHRDGAGTGRARHPGGRGPGQLGDRPSRRPRRGRDKADAAPADDAAPALDEAPTDEPPTDEASADDAAEAEALDETALAASARTTTPPSELDLESSTAAGGPGTTAGASSVSLTPDSTDSQTDGSKGSTT